MLQISGIYVIAVFEKLGDDLFPSRRLRSTSSTPLPRKRLLIARLKKKTSPLSAGGIAALTFGGGAARRGLRVTLLRGAS